MPGEYGGCQLGSSPRMRGAPRMDDVGRADARIIPADAGSTDQAYSDITAGEDHPRGCGEHPLA